jgi:ABC-type glycerol-3-phosphate transport system substrate-binding protein
VVFGLAIFIAVLLFSLSKAQGNKGISSVVVWGTFPQSTFTNSLEALNNKDDETGVKISYQQKNPATYNSELVEAFASGTGPDLFL